MFGDAVLALRICPIACWGSAASELGPMIAFIMAPVGPGELCQIGSRRRFSPLHLGAAAAVQVEMQVQNSEGEDVVKRQVDEEG